MSYFANQDLTTHFEAGDDGAVTLLGSRCPACGRVDFPAREVCLTCEARDVPAASLTGRGTVHESTTVKRPPAGFVNEYFVGMIDLDEGPRIFALLLSDCPHGSRVRAIAARLPSGPDAFAFEADRD